MNASISSEQLELLQSAERRTQIVQALKAAFAGHARAVLWHSEHRVLLNGHQTVLFK